LDLRDRKEQEDENLHNEEPNVNPVMKLRRVWWLENEKCRHNFIWKTLREETIVENCA
jgi:hypothetical protein